MKRLDRLAPNLVHVCGFVREWTYAYNSPHNTPGGFRGSQIQKTGKCGKTAGLIADESGNGHRLNKLAS